MELLEHKLNENIEIDRLLVKPNKKIRANALLFKYKVPHIDKPDKLLDYRAKQYQVVTEVCVQVGSVPKNTVIFRSKAGCLHPIVAFGLCSECGKDLKDDESVNPEKTVSMLHAIPQVSVSASEASDLGMSDILHQLKNKKLTLVVDLDQTIIHTSTTENIPEGIPGVFHFYLSNKKFRYSTRLRPGTVEFLNDMRKLYEMHVFTMGARDYADTITSFIDPDKKIFSSRILSRDECCDNHSKVPKLQALFPKGDRMVVIIDDRFDMWSNCNNLIRVRPYNFFEDVGDINDPNGKCHNRRNIQLSYQPETAQFKKNKPLDNEQTSFCFRTAQNNIKCVEQVPITSENKLNFINTFKTLKSLLLDGSFELSLLFLKNIAEKLKSLKETSPPSSPSYNETHIPTSELNTLDSQELRAELTEAMETDQSDTQTTTPPTTPPVSAAKKVKFSDDVIDNSGETEDHEGIITSLIESDDLVKSMSEFYIKHVEHGAERQKERDNQRMSSPVFKFYCEKSAADQDRYLDTLGGLLRKIHKDYYDNYTETRDVEHLPDTKVIIPRQRAVLTGCVRIVFSGIIPTNFPCPQNHPIWCAAIQLGAAVSLTLVKSGASKTTHLVTSRPDTGKVHQALKLGIKIVTEPWLWRCFESWEHVKTDDFEWKGLTGGKRAKSKSPERGQQLTEPPKTGLLTTMGDSMIEAMCNEVDEMLANDSESDYSSTTDSESSEEEETSKPSEEEETSKPSENTPSEAAALSGRKRSRSEVEEVEEEEALLKEGDEEEALLRRDRGEENESDNESLDGDLAEELEAEFSEDRQNNGEENGQMDRLILFK